MFIALKPIKFDRSYSVGEVIQEGVVLPPVVANLVSNGYIANVPDKQETKKVEVEDVADEVATVDEEVVVETVENTKVEEVVKEKEGFTREELSLMSKTELQKLLKVNGIEFKSKDNKDDLIEAFLK